MFEFCRAREMVHISVIIEEHSCGESVTPTLTSVRSLLTLVPEWARPLLGNLLGDSVVETVKEPQSAERLMSISLR